uniref:Uncharacterized protein n=1 Tax=Ditylenchus dipsaci TaxID=166011 RepID=A0A915EQV3_9BILA
MQFKLTSPKKCERKDLLCLRSVVMRGFSGGLVEHNGKIPKRGHAVQADVDPSRLARFEVFSFDHQHYNSTELRSAAIDVKSTGLLINRDTGSVFAQNFGTFLVPGGEESLKHASCR